MLKLVSLLVPMALVIACSSNTGPSASSAAEGLTGCHGKASSAIPSSGAYYLTTFGGPGEGQTMSCGQSTKSGTWYYAASRQRYGCGAHLQVEANGACVVVEADDYGPDVCVESAAGQPILDASPLVAKALFGSSQEGWSDRASVQVTLVDSSTPLGPCSAPTPPPSDPDAGQPSPTCSSDGDCNPGTEGSGMICVSGACVAGCNADWECPGVQVCVSGSCE